MRKLKADKAPITEIDVAVRELKARKRILEAKVTLRLMTELEEVNIYDNVL